MVNTFGHIVTQFDLDLRELEGLLNDMWNRVADLMQMAALAVKKLDLRLAQKVREGVSEVRAQRAEIEEKVTRILALRQPMAEDLRTVMSVLKITVDLERMGGHTKTIANRVAILADEKKIKSGTWSLMAMCEAVEAMTRDAMNAYFTRDPSLADEVRARDEAVDEMNHALFRELLTYMMENPRNIEASTHLLFMAKTVERLGDHCRNISDQIVYLVTGEQGF